MTPQVVAVVEARTITGPAKNLIRFATANRDQFSFHFVTYVRAKSAAAAERETNVFIDASRRAGIPVSVIWERGRFDPAVLRRLTDRIRALKPNLIQTHSLKSHFLLSLARKDLALPWLAFHHGYTNEDLKVRLFNLIDRFSLPRASQVVTVCGPFARAVAGYGVSPARIHVLHNSLDPSWAQAPKLAEEAGRIRASLPEGGAGLVLLSVGRFSTEKGHAVLLEAVSIVEQTGRAFSLILIGDGPLRSTLEAEVRSKGLESRILFAGQQRDVRPYFAASNILVLPSLSEGSPNVLLEAMAAKLPVVATLVGGVGEIVSDNETAFVVPGGNAAELAAAIARLLDDPELGRQFAERAHQRLIEHFSPAAYDRTLTAIYHSILFGSDRQVSDRSSATGDRVAI